MAAAPALAMVKVEPSDLLADLDVAGWRSVRPGRISWTKDDVEPLIE